MKRQPIRIDSKRADSPSIIDRSVALACSVCLLVVFFFATSSALATSGDEATLEGRTVVPLSAERPMVATLPPVGDHWIWVPDRLLSHSLLFDADSGRVLGMVDSPLVLTPQVPIIATDRNEIYSIDVAYSRGVRGERVDFLTVYDLETLDFKDEIVFPTKAATGNTAIGYSSRIGKRFLAVFNQFPATSVTILDLEKRSFVGEIGIAGCSGIYEVDDRRFATLCGDGTVTVIEVDEDGHKSDLVRSKKFFDTLEDPVFTAAGRRGSEWVFVSFAGKVHQVDFTGRTPVASPAWSLLGKDEGNSNWRPGGLQLVALHESSGRLFVVMHEGGPGSHKDAGPEVWSYDLTSKARIARIQPPPLTAAFLGGTLGLDSGSLPATLLRWILPADTIDAIAISQDGAPVLIMRNSSVGAVGVVEPDDGKALRILGDAGLFGPTLGTR